jgi:hypothetical protein
MGAMVIGGLNIRLASAFAFLQYFRLETTLEASHVYSQLSS